MTDSVPTVTVDLKTFVMECLDGAAHSAIALIARPDTDAKYAALLREEIEDDNAA